LLVGAMVGAFGAGRVADRIGRRPTILVTAVVFVVGVLLAAFTPTFWALIMARVVIGLAVGSASMTVPLYIGEVARRAPAALWSASTSWPSPVGSSSPTSSTTGWRPPPTGG
jgi:MFS family permease